MRLQHPSRGVTDPWSIYDLTVRVGGPPVAKGRPRVTRTGIAYTPAKTRKYETHVRMAAQEAMGQGAPVEGPLHVAVHAYLPVPKSWSKKKTRAALNGDVKPTSRPDVDNYAKAALDALDGIVWGDDSQVVRLFVCKEYAETAQLIIGVRKLTTC